MTEERPEFTQKWATTMTLHVIGAGFDTLGMTLTACLAFISETRDCQSKLFQELSQARKNGSLSDMPTYDQILALPYLQACIKEAMRLKPVIGMGLPRVVPQGGQIVSGQLLPQGTVLSMNPWVIHRDKQVYGQDANEYRPERYVQASKEQSKLMNGLSLAF